MSGTVCIAALILLDAARGGVTLVDALVWTLGGAIILLLAAVLAIVREKSDGTLRYLALLPIDGAEHALARGLTSLVLATPAGVVAGLLVPLLIPGGPAAAALIRGGSAVWDTRAAVAVRRFLPTQTGLVTASLALWLVIGIVLWIAARIIAHRGPRYRGEAAEA